MDQTILYYPTININDGQWLRNALLYWDNISSIVPYEGYEELSSDLIFLQSCGVYEAVYPEDLFNSEYSDDFCNTILNRISEYERSNRPKSFLGKKNTMVHKSKLHWLVTDALINNKYLPQGISKDLLEKKYPDTCFHNEWVEMDSKIAQIYMRTLAEFSIKSSHKDIILGTDKFTENQEIYCRTAPIIANQCCYLNIIDCFPQPSLETSFEDILKFKSSRRDELEMFKDKIQELEEKIYLSKNIDEIKYHEQRFVNNWRRYYKDYCKVLKDSKINFVLGNLSTLIAMPFVGDLLAEHIGPNFVDVAQIGLGALQMGVSYVNYRNKINPRTDSGFSYIISAREEGVTLV